jgi:hypothetical protein
MILGLKERKGENHGAKKELNGNTYYSNANIFCQIEGFCRKVNANH